MTTTLIVCFFNQYKEWPYVLHGIAQQTVKPDQVIVAIDDSRQKPPNSGRLKVTVARSDAKYDGVYSSSAARTAGLKKVTGDVIILLDSDCVPSPKYIETYKSIFEGRLKTWECESHMRKRTLKIEAKPKEEIYVGARYWIPKVEELPKPSENLWRQLKDLCTFDGHGLRGKSSGAASVWSCNMAFPKRAVELVPRFGGKGWHQDAKWYYSVKKHGFESRPSPDCCFVLHMGPDQNGAYY